MENIGTESLNSILENLKAEYEAIKISQVKIAITGQSGNGKSSIINALFGIKDLAKVGSTETTFEIKSYNHNGTILYDLPGCGTPNFPKDEYIEKCELETYDAAIIVTANRFMENDLWLINEMGKMNKPVYVVRTKMDEATVNEKRDNDLDEMAVFQKVLLDLEQNLKGVPIKGIYLISSVYPFKWDFQKLFEDVGNSLSDIKQSRFFQDVAILSVAILEKKKELAKKIIGVKSWYAAANGLNPIPGLDAGVDLKILTDMSQEIQDLYGLTDQHATALNVKLSGSKKATIVKQQLSEFAKRFILKEGIMLLLKKLSSRVATKFVSKFVPFIGHAVSAGIGYKLTHSFGEEIIEEANTLATEILDAGTNSFSTN